MNRLCPVMKFNASLVNSGGLYAACVKSPASQRRLGLNTADNQNECDGRPPC